MKLDITALSPDIAPECLLINKIHIFLKIFSVS